MSSLLVSFCNTEVASKVTERRDLRRGGVLDLTNGWKLGGDICRSFEAHEKAPPNS